jgi:hypothetical protein
MFKGKKNSRPRVSRGGWKMVLSSGGLSGLDCQDLTAFVVAAGGAGLMRGQRAAALAALVHDRCVPAVGGFACAQAHLRGFAFWNSHGVKSI